ncbi:MAG: acetylglutamate kinase [Candidatus Omnitrophica bacterium]|nr:acetylglutamate kinase [Candidatus Omnitrophota bacterium]MDD5310362.1 acetylglutamate kinase [Candidatus Omnitrophota bacterium]MDD5545907.1 acetylglutamate kinase [Candidatus Omnitrophota bacterium]
MQDIIKKADVLIEALPYIRKFRGKTVVIKAGGSMMENREVISGIFQDIIFMSLVGIKPVIIHGGGPRITEKMKEAGIVAKFVDGFRVTDSKTMKIVDDTLEATNKEIAKHIEELGGKVKALSGKKDKIIKAVTLKHKGKYMGFLGKIVSVNTKPIKDALKAGAIPVITPVAAGKDGKAYNINADLAACDIAAALKAEKFVLITDTNGILRDESDENTLIPTLKRKEAEELIERGVIRGGMIPKVKAVVDALKKGVNKTHIIDGRLSHAILLEVFTDKGIGTEIIK